MYYVLYRPSTYVIRRTRDPSPTHTYLFALWLSVFRNTYKTMAYTGCINLSKSCLLVLLLQKKIIVKLYDLLESWGL